MKKNLSNVTDPSKQRLLLDFMGELSRENTAN